jgi:hypothetical protein
VEVGVALYYEDDKFLVGELARIEGKLALLPQRVRQPLGAVPGGTGDDENAASD